MKNCPTCKKENPEIAIFCERCEFPFEGTEKEKSIIIGKFISKKGVKYDKEDSLIRSQKILGFIAILDIIFLIVLYKILPLGIVVFNSIIISIFVFCALTINKRPFIKVLIPLIIISLPTIAFLIIDASLFMTKIIINSIYIGALAYSLVLVKKHADFVKNFED